MQNIEDRILFWKNHNLNNYLKKGNDLNITQQEIGVIEDWLRSDSAQRYRRQIQKLSVDIALNLACNYKIKKRDSDYTNENEEVICDYEFSNGFRIVQLLKKSALNKESKFMRNCLAKFEIELEESYYSLRDNSNKPHATINTCGNEVVQIKGFANSVVRNAYFDLIMEWVAYKNLIIIEPNNFYYLNAILINNKDIIKVNDLFHYDEVVVSHGIHIHDLKYNLRMPKKMTIIGDVTFSNLQENVILPEEMIIYGSLIVENCKGISPRKIVVHGSVDFVGCSFSTGFGDISCSHLLIEKSIGEQLFKLDTTTPNVRIIEENLVKEIEISNFYGKLDIENCAGLLKITGENCRLKSMTIESCKKLKSIPSNLITEKLDFKGMKISNKIVKNDNWGKINLLGFHDCQLKKFDWDLINGSFFKITLNRPDLDFLKIKRNLNLIEMVVQNSDKLKDIDLDFELRTLVISGLNSISSVNAKADCLVLKDCGTIGQVYNYPKNTHSLEISRTNVLELGTNSLINWLELKNASIHLVNAKLQPVTFSFSNGNFAPIEKSMDFCQCSSFTLVDKSITKIDQSIIALDQIDLQCPKLEEIGNLKSKIVSINRCDSLKQIGENTQISDYLLLSKKQNFNLILKTNELFVKKQIAFIKYTER